jgi:two-component system OmpR family response regulator
MAERILVVDDDENIVRLLKLYLGDAGYEVTTAADGSEAMSRFRESKPDLVLLDVMLPVINGWEVLHLIRSEFTTPVIMLTSRDMVEDKLKGFSLGADDYVVKPFEPQEVLARIQVRIKHDAVPAEKSVEKERGVIECGNLRVDLNRYDVIKNGVKAILKPKEIQLIYFLMQNRNIVFSRAQLLEKVWEYDFLVDTRTVDVHVKRLRQLLEPSNSNWSLKTVWGVGYKFEVR